MAEAFQYSTIHRVVAALAAAAAAVVFVLGTMAASGRSHPVRFRDVAQQSGVIARLVSGSEDEKKHIIETAGTGVAFLDYDNDGWQDIFLVNGSRLEGFGCEPAPTNHLYRNNRDGRFVDVTHRANLVRSGWGTGVCTGDFDNDADDDIYITYWGGNVLYRNSGDGSFTDVTARGGVRGDDRDWGTGCTFLDYDRDGHLDLFVASYMVLGPVLQTSGAGCERQGLLGHMLCNPSGRPTGKGTLYRNRGDGTFEDVSPASGVREVEPCYAFTAVAADLNQDGWTDLYVACDTTASILLRNNRDGTFRNIALEAGVALSEHGYPQAGMGVGVGDYDNDGCLDLIKTNFSNDLPNLYRCAGPEMFQDEVCRSGLGRSSLYIGWGVGFADVDNDGWKDIFQVNGHLYPELEKLNADEGYRQPRLVYRNLGDGRFEDISEAAGFGAGERRSSRGAAFADYDNDGDIDVLVMNMGEAPSLLRNDLNGPNHWIRVKFQGTRSNRSAIGAVLIIEAGGSRQTAAVVSQSSFLSQNDRRLHFGLGIEKQVQKFTIHWPSGAVEDFPGAAAGREVLLVEGRGSGKKR